MARELEQRRRCQGEPPPTQMKCVGADLIQIWCTRNLQPLYIIHPCDDTSGDIYSLAWDERYGGTLYFGTSTSFHL